MTQIARVLVRIRDGQVEVLTDNPGVQVLVCETAHQEAGSGPTVTDASAEPVLVSSVLDGIAKHRPQEVQAEFSVLQPQLAAASRHSDFTVAERNQLAIFARSLA